MTQEFHHQLETLRQQFIAGLPERARHLDNIWSHLRHLNWSQQGLLALQQFVRKQAQAGSSYALPELHANALELDNFLNELQALKRNFGGQEYAQLEHHVERLSQTMNTIAKGTGSQAQLPEPISQSTYPEAAGKTLFVIDPDRPLAVLCSVYLRQAGFAVEYFENLTECLARLHQLTPSAILMDPDFERAGLQSLTHLQQIKALTGTHTPILLMSGRTDMNAKLRALRAGSSDYLIKPPDMNLLVERLLHRITEQHRHYKVMIVDDDPNMAALETELLRAQGMEVIYLQQPLQGLQQAARHQPDLVVMDMHMPDITGLELAALLRQDPDFLLLPIVFVTADTNPQLHSSMKALGVNAVLTKPFADDDFVRTCEQVLNQTSLLTNRIARVTRHHQLPQKINRSYFFSALDEEIQNSASDLHSSALYYLSIDKLHELSQQQGLVELIKLHDQFCHRLDDCISSDEQWIDLSNMVLCILAGKRSAEFHRQRCVQLARHLSAQAYQTNGEPLTLTINTGIALLKPALGNANQALLFAEQDFEASLSAAEPEPVELPETITIPVLTKVEPDFSQIVFDRDLLLAFQPIISLESAHIDHFSVLLRLQGEDGEAIAAKQFLRRINRPSQRIELDRWVLQQAVAAISANSATREQATLFIHLAEDTLQQNSFFSFTANVLRASRLRGAKRLIFMLEESWVINHLHQAQEIAKALRDIQCGICLIHAGENPLVNTVLEQLPLDYLRLAPALTNDQQQPELLSALTAAAHQRGINLIATQIENSSNLSSLWTHGVRLFEGFFIQPPDKGFHLENDILFANELALDPNTRR